MFDSVLQALDSDGNGCIDTQEIRYLLRQAGIPRNDPRLCDFNRRLDDAVDDCDNQMCGEALAELIGSRPALVDRAVRGELAVPHFPAFAAQLLEIFETTAGNRSGQVANYIPQLARVPRDRFALAVCTIDGQRASMGNAEEPFTLQSSCKPILYAAALMAHGEERVHRHIGREPSGQSFNELTLDRNSRPHIPMINAGAIVSASLFLPDLPMADRHEALADLIARLSGGARPGFDSAVFHSERDNADRNFALAHYMREMKAFPDGTDIYRTMDLYFAACSMQTCTSTMATIAATFANGGICPPTGERILSADTVKHCLSMMYSCGMYDHSGEFAFRVGIPAKSAVSGIIMAVVPNLMGIAVWSPRLDPIGNSVRGVEFLQRLVDTFSFHNYDSVQESTKIDPRCDRQVADSNAIFNAIQAASRNDVEQLRRLVALGHSLDVADYDGRTPLHLAAVEGHAAAVQYILAQNVALAPSDRWGNTPLDDATRMNWSTVIELLSPSAVAAQAEEAGDAPKAA